MPTTGNFEQDRCRYVWDVRQLLVKVFELSEDEVAHQDKTWKDWLGLRRQESRELCELLKADVNDSFKARAIAILLVPSVGLVPFAWQESGGLGSYLFLHNSVALTSLSPMLQEFTLALLEINIRFLESAPGWVEAVYHYNRFILQALALLGEDDVRAARLFDRYQINDPQPYYSLEGASGYNPIRTLFGAEVPEKWKRLGDEKMRSVIREEQEGRAQPRCDWEKALPNYVAHIQLGFYGKEFHYGVELFASQVDFVLLLPNISGQRLFSPLQVGAILRMLGGEDRKELRHRFVRHMILDDHGTYGTYQAPSQDTLAYARMMFEEFGASDAELRARLETIIAEGEAKARDREASARAQQSQAESVMAGMRR